MSRLSEFSDELESLVATAAPSVVAVEHGRGQGSGIIVSGDGYVVTGWSELDELPEAFELPDRRFALGVQWHPESDETSRLVGALVAAAAVTSPAAAG